MTSVLPFARSAREAAPSSAAIDALTDALAAQLAATAIARDRAGGHAAHERQLIRDSGLLSLTVPRELGGMGHGWATFYRVLRRLAEADSALAHVFGFHHLQLASILLYGNEEQRERLQRDTIEQGVFWGNALNPRDTRLVARPADGGGWVLDGIKSFASGSVGSDRLTLSAVLADSGELLIGALRTGASGITVQADWDAFGQRQTDSGNVRFDKVFLPQADVLRAPGAAVTPRSALRALLAQMILVSLYLGIARGAFDAGKRYTREQSRPWPASGVAAATDDPFVQHRYGELWLHVRAAQALADEAALRLDSAMQQLDTFTFEQRADLAIAVAEAKVLAHRAALEVSSQMFELTGASATSARHGLDRFWRNARVHTLHDPVDYKLRDIGRYRLSDTWPEPSSYS